MIPTTDLLRDIFDITNGDITLSDANGETFTSGDFGALADWCASHPEPWVDLVTTTGEAAGVYTAGLADVVEPAPSIPLDDGFVYLIDAPVPNMPRDVHVVPVASLNLAYEGDRLVTYDPTTLDVQSDASRTEVKLAQGRHRAEYQGKWKTKASTFGVFSDFIRLHAEGPKDGPCFLQGECAGGHRKAAAMVTNYILGVDLDSGAPVADVIASIQRSGLEAVIYTTHSHLKNTSVIKRDHFHKWAQGEEPTDELVADYLQQVKGVLPEIVEECRITNDAHHTEEGIVICVEHRPMPKFRVVFPLAEPFVFAKRGGTQQDAINEWKERYAGFCSEMGFFFDEKCADPARLFYYPRHNPGDPHGSWMIYGRALKIDDYDRVRIVRGRGGRRSTVADNAFTAAAQGAGDDDEADRYITEGGFDLKRWAAKYAKRFEIESMLTDISTDLIRDPRTGGKPGTHVECPFEPEHTNFGGGGTYVVSAGDNLGDGYEGGFTFHCVHNACSGRNRLDFLKELIDQQIITPEDLQNRAYMLELEDDEDEEEEREESRPASRTPRRERDADRQEADDGDLSGDDDGDTEEALLRSFNRRYAVVVTSGGVKILREPDEGVPDSDVQFLSQNDVALLEKNRVLWVSGRDGKNTKIEVFKSWLEWEKRRTYRGVVFIPGEECPPHIYNLFRGFPIRPIPGDWSLLRSHLYENICESNDELFDWFMTWLAHVIQKPNKKPGSTIAVTGEKGTGKSILFGYFSKLLGRHGITVSQRKQIVGQFNAHLATCLLMVCEEAFWAADPQAEGVLKDMITNEKQLIEKKGYDPIQTPNFTRLALISNLDWVVPASLKDERRFGVFRCSSARRGDIEFFESIAHQMDQEGGLEAMMHELMNWKPLRGWGVLFNPPVTEHLKKQQIESLSGIEKFMLELVKSGVYESTNENIDAIELNDDKPTTVYAVHMRQCVEEYVRYKFASDKARTGYDDIAAVVMEWFGAREAMLNVEGQMNKKRAFTFPSLNDVREHLRETKGLDIEAMSVEEVKKIRTR